MWLLCLGCLLKTLRYSLFQTSGHTGHADPPLYKCKFKGCFNATHSHQTLTPSFTFFAFKTFLSSTPYLPLRKNFLQITSHPHKLHFHKIKIIFRNLLHLMWAMEYFKYRKKMNTGLAYLISCPVHEDKSFKFCFGFLRGTFKVGFPLSQSYLLFITFY